MSRCLYARTGHSLQIRIAEERMTKTKFTEHVFLIFSGAGIHGILRKIFRTWLWNVEDNDSAFELAFGVHIATQGNWLQNNKARKVTNFRPHEIDEN